MSEVCGERDGSEATCEELEHGDVKSAEAGAKGVCPPPGVQASPEAG